MRAQITLNTNEESRTGRSKYAITSARHEVITCDLKMVVAASIISVHTYVYIDIPTSKAMSANRAGLSRIVLGDNCRQMLPE